MYLPSLKNTVQKNNLNTTIMKKVKNIFHKIANADPMIWGYVMLNETK